MEIEHADSNHSLEIVLTLCFIIVVDSLGLSLVYPVLAPIFSIKIGGIMPLGTSLHSRDIYYGIAMAIFPIFMFIGAPLMGDLSDCFGRKRILLICLIGEAVGMLVTGISVTISSVMLLLIARAFSGLMAANMPVAQAAIIDVSTDKNKILNISLIGLSNTLGFVFGPLLSGIVSGYLGFSAPFYAAMLLACANCIILIFIFNETRIIKEKKISIFSGMIMFILVFREKKIRNLSIVYLLHVTSWIFYVEFICLFLVQKYNYSTTQIGYFISWIALILSIALLFIIRVLVKILSVNQITTYSIAMILIGTVSAMDFSLRMQWISSILISIGAGLVYSSMLTLFSNSVNEDKQGWIMGAVGALVAVGGGIAGIMISLIVPISYEASFLSMLICWSLSLIIFLYTS